MFIYLVVGLIIVAAIAPFVPGWIELRRGKDSAPLHIDMEYSKNPLFFGNNFDALLHNALFPAAETKEGAAPDHALEQKDYTVTISRPEKVSVFTAPDWTFAPFARAKNIVYATGNLNAGEGARFAKEVCVEGDADIAGKARLRAILCKGELNLGPDVTATRWVDARGKKLTVGPNCDLGRNAVSGGLLSLNRGCKFINLSGSPIRTHEAPPKEPLPTEGNIRENALVTTSLLLSIPSGAEVHNNIVASQDLKICSGSAVYGDIKGHRNVELEDNVTIHGSIMADQDITIRTNCRISGNVFAQGDIHVGFGSVVGEEGHIKSIISRSGVRLEPSVTVHGHIACEKGLVSEDAGRRAYNES